MCNVYAANGSKIKWNTGLNLKTQGIAQDFPSFPAWLLEQKAFLQK